MRGVWSVSGISSDSGHGGSGGCGRPHGWKGWCLLQVSGSRMLLLFLTLVIKANVIWSHMEAKCSNSDIDFNLVNPNEDYGD